MLLVSLAETIFPNRSRFFQRGTLSLCRSKGCKVAVCQTFLDDPIVQDLNPGHCSYLADIQTISPTHQVIILIKFHDVKVKLWIFWKQPNSGLVAIFLHTLLHKQESMSLFNGKSYQFGVSKYTSGPGGGRGCVRAPPVFRRNI